jgi:excisionase family DNA binding protein
MTLSPTMMLDEVASYLSMTEGEVLKLVRSGELPASKQGESWRFLREEVDHWLEEQIPHFPTRELHGVEKAPAFLGGHAAGGKSAPLLEGLLLPSAVELQAHARTRASILTDLGA